MLKIFSDPESPFFKSALPIEVGPIASVDFAAFILRRFKAGGRKISPEFAAKLIGLADGVSGDVQELCDALWERTDEDSTVGEEDLPAAMDCIFSRECGGFEAALARMTSRQMRVALALAECPTGSIFAADFMERAGMTNAGAMKKAVDRFVKDRLVFLKDGVYRFSNPFFKEWIKDRLG